MPDMIADIAVNAPLKNLFSYTVPESLESEAKVGMRVKIQFGRRSGVGTILSLRQGDSSGLKPLKELIDQESLLPESLVKLLRWAADYYCYPIGPVVKNALPADIGGDHSQTKIILEAYFSCLQTASTPRGKKQQEILEFIASANSAGMSQIRERFPAPYASLKKLVEDGYLKEEQQERIRDPFQSEKIPEDKVPTLTAEQKACLDAIIPVIEADQSEVFLVHGVTGSGKTEIYLKAVDACLKLGRQALILVPEISLTPQLVARFRARFSRQDKKIAVLHSGLSAGERYDAWREISRNKVQIVIGARSAIFAPLSNPGLIVVDEEHDSSYKQTEGFRYNARDLALVRGQQQDCPVLLGSATPSFASYYRSEQKLLTRLSLMRRIHSDSLPKVELIDLREQVLSGSLANTLIEAIQEALEKREQVLLLLNRRGYAPFLLCGDCGETFYCPNCSITLTFHQKKRHLRCHYCDYIDEVPETCGKCQSLNITTPGAGTERLEEELIELFPGAQIARMDRDSTTRKGAHQKIMMAMMDRKVDILIGTQMIAKGHDFPGVSLVGVVNADSGLNLPDFRCAERGFALLTQVAGRAGRSSGGGRVFIQSYNPEHYALECAVDQDYQKFYQQELPFRQELGYPPCGHLANLIFSGIDLDQVTSSVDRFARYLERCCNGVQVLGPSPCPLARLRGKNRYQILLKSNDRPALRSLLMKLDGGRQFLARQVTMQIDVDPLEML